MPRERRVRKEGVGPAQYLFISIAVLISDQTAKFFALKNLSPDISIPILKNVFHLTLVLNKGIAFGFLKDRAPFLIAIGIISAGFLLYFLPRIKKEALSTRIAAAMVLGGILGNLIDRIRFGYVVDFLDFLVWPVFNIADSCITIGAVLICWDLLKRKKS